MSLSDAEREALRFPALPWLDEILGSVPKSTSVTLAFMPIHVASQPVPGSPAAARDAACKARITRIAERHGATVVDFRRPSPVTTEDSNYWDPLHYRLGIAERVAEGLRVARETGSDAPDGFYRVPTGPGPRGPDR